MSSRLPLFCLIGIFALIGLAPIAMAIVSVPPSGQTAVMFDPRLDRSDILQAVADADVSLVRFGGLPGTVVVDVPEAGMSRLVQAGAWIIADPILLGGCQTDSSNISRPDLRGV